MSGKRIIESMKEAVAISKGKLPAETYKIHIPKKVDVKSIRESRDKPVHDCFIYQAENSTIHQDMEY